MAYTVSFPTTSPLPGPEDLASWCTEQGEAFDHDGPDVLSLRGLPVRLLHTGEAIRAQVDVTPSTALSRLTRVLFDLSVRLGADVRLVGVGEVNRPALWLRLADEQDRQRIAGALERASSHSAPDEVYQGLWGVLGALGGGRDLRWEATREQIVEMKEVGAPEGISVEEAAWHDDQAEPGDTIALPVSGDLHIVAWRWLQEAWPNLADD
ncbi:MAG: hypothetical protein H6732_10705 [Alphaproteobacteria bacterium]|nr:hypothetical protein [Alphaproteobacteria bacterium]